MRFGAGETFDLVKAVTENSVHHFDVDGLGGGGGGVGDGRGLS